MNKKLTLSLAMAAIMSLMTTAQSASIPYRSDMFTDVTTMDEGWAKSNSGNRRALVFEYDRDNSRTDALKTPGTSTAACHNYDSDYDANCWMYSPSFDLKAGTTYTVGVWAKTKGGDDENFKICYGAGQTAAEMTTILLDRPGFLSPDDYTFVSSTFTPTEDMTVNFGINCYSDANSYVLSLTGFSVVEGEGGGDHPVIPDNPDDPRPGEAIALPYSCVFDNADASNDWIFGHGTEAELTDNWQFNSWSKWMVFDIAQNKKEDNYMISPELNFDKVGTYAIIYTGLAQGNLEFLLGTSTTDLSDYVLQGSLNNDSYDNDAEYTIYANVTEPGNYRLAIRAHAEAGTFMGYRMKAIRVRSDAAMPALVNDLTAVADAFDGLSVSLSWTYPAVDHHGDPLTAITKAELYRNGELLKEINDARPGMFSATLDEVPAAGVYSYHVLVYNENGRVDADPIEVSAGYVGRPEADMPYSALGSNTDQMALFTIVDNNNDGNTWHIDNSSYLPSMQIEPEEITPLDDYLVTPYLHLTPGYYKFMYSLSSKNNSYEAGYVTNRHDAPGTFVKLGEVIDYPDYYAKDNVKVFAVEQEGDYALCIHAIGESSNSSWREISLASIGLESTVVLPACITEFTGTEGEIGDDFIVNLSWTNPAVDNAGNALDPEAPLTITVMRNNQALEPVTGYPGQAMTWNETLTEAGEYEYTVKVSNANGMSEDEAPVIALNVGPTLKLPYEVSNFADWYTGSSWYSWEYDETTGFVKWENSYAWSFDYSVFSPYVRLEAGKAYTLEATFDGYADEEMDVRLVTSPANSDYEATDHHFFTLPQAASDHLLSITIVPTPADAPALAEELNDEESPETKVAVNTGKLVIGFRPNKAGAVTLKSFKLSEKVASGIENVAVAADEAHYANGVVTFDAPVAITVTDITGRVLCTAFGTSVDLRDLRGAGIVIVSAPGHRALKLAM